MPGGQLVGKFEGDGGPAPRVGADGRGPEGGVGELLADELRTHSRHCGAAPAALRLLRDADADAVHGDGEVVGGADGEAAPAVEGLHDGRRVGRGQRQDGLIHHRQPHLRLHRIPVGVRDLYVQVDGLPRAVVLALRDVPVGGDADRQLLLLGGDGEGDVAQPVRGDGVGLVHPLHQDDGDEGVGGHVGGDGQVHRLGVARQRLHPVLDDVAPLHGEERGHLPLEGGRDEDTGRLAGAVLPLVGDEIDAVVVLLAPGDVLPPGDPEPGRRDDAVAPRVGPFGLDDVGAARRRDEGRRRLTLIVRRHGGRGDDGVGDGPGPVEIAVLVLLLDVEPLPSVEGDGEGDAGDGLPRPVHRPDVHLLLLPGDADVLLGAQADVEEALVDQDLGPVGDGLVGDVGDGGLKGELLAHQGVADVGGDGEDEAALGVGGPFAVGDDAAVAGHLLRPPPVPPAGVGPVPPAGNVGPEPVVLGHQRPADLRVGDGAAEEVGGLDGDVDPVARQDLVFIRGDRHLDTPGGGTSPPGSRRRRSVCGS
jgi:hypothetical protein